MGFVALGRGVGAWVFPSPIRRWSGDLAAGFCWQHNPGGTAGGARSVVDISAETRHNFACHLHGWVFGVRNLLSLLAPDSRQHFLYATVGLRALVHNYRGSPCDHRNGLLCLVCVDLEVQERRVSQWMRPRACEQNISKQRREALFYNHARRRSSN